MVHTFSPYIYINCQKLILTKKFTDFPKCVPNASVPIMSAASIFSTAKYMWQKVQTSSTDTDASNLTQAKITWPQKDPISFFAFKFLSKMV